MTGLRDRLGVLSVYVDLDPGQRSIGTPSWRFELGHALRAIERHVETHEPRTRRRRVGRRLARLRADIDALLDPAHCGRGRALFAALGDGLTHVTSAQLPLPSTAVLDREPYVGPLVGLVERWRPAGLVTAFRAGVTTHDWRYGAIEPVGEWELDADASDRREPERPASSNPDRAQQTAPRRDRFVGRLEERQVRAIVGIAERVERLGRRLGWHTLLVGGDPRLTSPLEVALAGAGPDVVRAERLRGDLGPGQRDDVARAALVDVHTRRERALLDRVLAAAAAGRGGCLGLERTATALLDGRVAHLVVDLETDGTSGAGERLVRHALEQGVAIMPVCGDTAAPLAEHDGVGALLRC